MGVETRRRIGKQSEACCLATQPGVLLRSWVSGPNTSGACCLKSTPPGGCQSEAVGPEGALTYDPVGCSSVGGMPRDPAVGMALGGMLSQRYGGMLPNFPAGGVTIAGAQPVFDSVGSVDVGQRSSAVGGGVYVRDGCHPVQGKLAEKIWSWEYVEMAELLPEQWATKREDLVVPVGLPRRRRQVTNIDLWLQCFTSYVSVMSRRLIPGRCGGATGVHEVCF